MTALVSKEELFQRLTDEAEKVERRYMTTQRSGHRPTISMREMLGETRAYQRAAAIVAEATEYQV